MTAHGCCAEGSVTPGGVKASICLQTGLRLAADAEPAHQRQGRGWVGGGRSNGGPCLVYNRFHLAAIWDGRGSHLLATSRAAPFDSVIYSFPCA